MAIGVLAVITVCSVHADDIGKTAIITPFDSFEFLRMPFGFAGQTFRRFIDESCAAWILSSVTLTTCSFPAPRRLSTSSICALRTVFQRLDAAGITIHPSKCVFGVPTLDFLGYHISSAGVAPSRVIDICQFPLPSSKSQLARFLGMVNFYHRFIPHCASLLATLQNVLRTASSDDISSVLNLRSSVSAARQALVSATLLAHPQSRPDFHLHADASTDVAGGALHQCVDGMLQPLAFFSRRFTATQCHYIIFDKELSAMYMAIKHFRHFVEGSPLTVCTDHRPLTFVLAKRVDNDWTPHQQRYISFIAEFATSIVFLSGRNNVVADTLSRPTVSVIDFFAIGTAQAADEQLQYYLSSRTTGLRLRPITPGDGGVTLICDSAHGRCRPFVPPSFSSRRVPWAPRFVSSWHRRVAPPHC